MGRLKDCQFHLEHGVMGAAHAKLLVSNRDVHSRFYTAREANQTFPRLSLLIGVGMRDYLAPLSKLDRGIQIHPCSGNFGGNFGVDRWIVSRTMSPQCSAPARKQATQSNS